MNYESTAVTGISVGAVVSIIYSVANLCEIAKSPGATKTVSTATIIGLSVGATMAVSAGKTATLPEAAAHTAVCAIGAATASGFIESVPRITSYLFG